MKRILLLTAAITTILAAGCDTSNKPSDDTVVDSVPIGPGTDSTVLSTPDTPRSSPETSSSTNQ